MCNVKYLQSHDFYMYTHIYIVYIQIYLFHVNVIYPVSSKYYMASEVAIPEILVTREFIN